MVGVAEEVHHVEWGGVVEGGDHFAAEDFLPGEAGIDRGDVKPWRMRKSMTS